MNAIALAALLAAFSCVACTPPPPEPPPPQVATPEDMAYAKDWLKGAMKQGAVVSLNCPKAQALINLRWWRLEPDKKAIAHTLIAACGLHPASATLAIHDAASAAPLAIWRTGGLRKAE